MDVSRENSQSEREQLSQDIERIKRALEDSDEVDDVDDTDEENYVLHVDTDWEEDEDDEEEEEMEDNVLNDSGASQRHDPTVASNSNRVPLLLQDGQLPNDTETCLALNRAYQEMLMENLKNIELELVKNREKQTQLKHEIESAAEDRLREGEKRKPLSVYAIPYFRDVDGKVPPMNYDTQLKKASQTMDEIIKPNKIWFSSEKRLLMKAVKQNVMEKLMRPIMNKKEREEEKLESGALDEDEVTPKIQEYDQQILKIKNMSPEELHGCDTDATPIDWLKISSTDLNGTRSAVNCELVWTNALHPSINTSRWNGTEDSKLEELVKKYDGHDWKIVAADLNTNRTPFQCLQRYQTRVNPLLQTGKWTNEEDKVLNDVIQNVTESFPGSVIPWDQVAYFMEGRSWEQCKERWSILHPMDGHRRGKWSAEEDMLLIEAVGRFGFLNWQKVKDFVPFRTSHQCRERWKNCLDLEVSFATWTYEEDKMLWLMTQKYGEGKWSEICEHIPGRLDQPCLKRYKILKKWQEQDKFIKKLPVSMLPKMKEFPSLAEFIRVELQKIQENCNRGKVKSIEDDIEMLENDLQAMTNFSGNLAKAFGEQSLIQSKKTLLEVLRHRYDEYKFKHDQEDALIAEDCKIGICIPRPPFGKYQSHNGALQAHVRRRSHLHALVQKRVQRAKDGGHGLDIKAESDMARIIEGERLPFVSGSVHEKAMRLMQAATVVEMQKATEKLKHQLLYRGRRKPPGRPSLSKDEIDIDNKLLRLMRTRVSASRRVGRPRKYLTKSVASKKPLTSVISEPISLKVGRLMLQAMNVDMEGSVKAALRHTPPAALHSLSQDKTKATVSVTGDVGLFVKSMAEDFTRFHEQILCREKDLNKPASVHSHNSQDTSNQDASVCVLSVPQIKSKKFQSNRTVLETTDEEEETSDRRPHTPPPRQQRQQLIGPNAARMYTMPPLPPTCATINAFKNLLLNRRFLVQIAKRYHVPGELGTHPRNVPKHPHVKTEVQSPPSIGASMHVAFGDLTATKIFSPKGNDERKDSTDVSNANNSDETSQVMNSKGEKSVTFSSTPGAHSSLRVSDTDTNARSSTGSNCAPSQSDQSLSRVITGLEKDQKLLDANIKDHKFHFITLYAADVDLPIFNSMANSEKVLIQNLLKKKKSIRMRVPANMDLDELEKSLGRSLDSKEGQTDTPPTEKPGVETEKKCGSIINRIRNTHDYQLLKARFNGLFLWPALLSTVLPPEPDPAINSFNTFAATPAAAAAAAAAVAPAVAKSKTKTQESKATTEEAVKIPGSKKKKKMKFPCTRGKKFRKYVIKSREDKVKFLETCRTRIKMEPTTSTTENISTSVAEKDIKKKRRPYKKRSRKCSTEPEKPPSSRVQQLTARKEIIEAQQLRVEAEMERIKQEELRMGIKKRPQKNKAGPKAKKVKRCINDIPRYAPNDAFVAKEEPDGETVPKDDQSISSGSGLVNSASDSTMITTAGMELEEEEFVTVVMAGEDGQEVACKLPLSSINPISTEAYEDSS